MRGIQQKSIRLTSCQNSIEKVGNFVETLAEQFHLSPDRYGDILVSVTEAVNNAIIHGNCEDTSKTIELCLKKQKRTIAISVTDQGTGFDYMSVPDPTHPENICNCGGRGVYLMRQLSDEVQFRNNGSTVEMKFNI